MISDQLILQNHGDGAGTGIVILFGGGGGCIRQSMNFQTAITTSTTSAVATQYRTVPPRN